MILDKLSHFVPGASYEIYGGCQAVESGLALSRCSLGKGGLSRSRPPRNHFVRTFPVS